MAEIDETMAAEWDSDLMDEIIQRKIDSEIAREENQILYEERKRRGVYKHASDPKDERHVDR